MIARRAMRIGLLVIASTIIAVPPFDAVAAAPESGSSVSGTSVSGASVSAPPLSSSEAKVVAEVERQVMCPSCDTTLNNSHSPSAERMRVYIQVQAAKGRAADTIIEDLVDQYGGDESIRAVPQVRGVGVLAWVVPLVFMLVVAAFALRLLRRWATSAPSAVDESEWPHGDDASNSASMSTSASSSSDSAT
jgi:cytochrome c-type biogenesis protein CcmH/NrfF